MTKNLNTTVLQKFRSLRYQDLDWKTVFFFLVVISVFIRFPFFFRDYVDRDESTFILMGQSWVNGHLPYTQLWDLKPPITFLYFAIIIKIFGKSFFAIRLFGSLLVALTAWFTYGIASKITSKKIAFWVAVFCIFFQSLFGSLQGVMSEHICTFFFVAALFILFTKEDSKWFFTAGLLLGLSVMTKLNMAYPVLSLGIFYLWEGFHTKRLWIHLKYLVFMGIGFVMTILFTLLPYYLQGISDVWWKSIFEAPLAYSGGKFHSPLKTVPFILVSIGFFYITYKKKLLNFKSKPIQLLIMCIAGVFLSFAQAGKVNGHYLIQLYPYILIPMGMAVSKLPAIPKKFSPIAIVLLVLIPMESYLEYGNIISNKLEKGSFYNGEGIDVPKYILDHRLGTENIFFTEYHIGYWLLDELPPTSASTHPSNIAREELFPYMNNPSKSGLEELRYIMEVIQPNLVVARKGKRIFYEKLVEYNTYIDAYLAQHYELKATVDRGLIYQRLE